MGIMKVTMNVSGHILSPDEISMGDYVLTGGELPVMTMTDAIVRLIPGVLGNEQSHQDDSFSDGLLEFPAIYTSA